MALQEHVELIKQGVSTWNRWRKEHPEIQPDFEDANLCNTNLQEASLENALFNRADLRETDLSRANLRQSSFIGTHLTYTIMEQADLSGANLYNVDFSEIFLRECNLSNADLSRANLSGIDLSEMRLVGAVFYETNLTRTILKDADLHNAILGLTIFADVDLRSTRGLEHVVHLCKSYLSLDILLRSGKDLPLAFLRGVGLSDSVITTFQPSNSPKTLNEAHACFISYAQEDLPFAQQLADTLQNKGIRCWLDQEDQIGNTLRFSIPHILVLSTHSVREDWRTPLRSAWASELATDALAIERWEARKVLFPVRLDEISLQVNKDWMQQLYQSREIIDFTHWQDKFAYQQTIQKLLSELNGLWDH